MERRCVRSVYGVFEGVYEAGVYEAGVYEGVYEAWMDRISRARIRNYKLNLWLQLN